MNQKKKNIILGAVAFAAITAAIVIAVINSRPPVVEQPPADPEFVARPNRAVSESYDPEDDLEDGEN